MTNQDWRPSVLSEYIGQKRFIGELDAEIKASIRDIRPVRHLLLSGAPGLGKDSIAGIIATARGSPPPVMLYGAEITHALLTETLIGFESPGYSSPAHPKGAGFLLEPEKAIFPIIVINECQSMPLPMMELLHPVLEPGADGRRIFDGLEEEDGRTFEGPGWVVGLTVIMITNYLGTMLQKSRATVNRLPIQYQFEYYEDEDIKRIVLQFSAVTGMTFDDDAALHLAKRAYGVPRQAINLLKRVPDLLAEWPVKRITLEMVKQVLCTAGYDENGLTNPMLQYLKRLNLSGGRLSLQSLAGMLDTDEKTIAIGIEPGLLKADFVRRCAGGRVLTAAGRAILDGSVKKSRLSKRAI
ncbi:MAG: Holliday junction DNA helicase RuvB C-terminal domain-containing protein [Phycisphaerae bacterium]